MPSDVEKHAAQSEQSKKSKNATLDLLKNKRRSETTFKLYLTDTDGEKTEVELTFRAIGMTAYDRLVGKHPPKKEQIAEGASFNMDTFAPALISACSVDPDLTPEDALDIWNSPDWSRGDLMVLFRNAVDVNNRGLDIPFSESV